MTPLEMAKQRASKLTCRKCPKIEIVDNIAYCGVSGKILLTKYLDIAICDGKRLKEQQNER